MGVIYSRVKTWTSTEDITASDLNAEFDNILNNGVPLQFDDYSTNVAQMQTTTDPGEVGTESLATTLAGEIERLRFSIGEIKGSVSKWYSSAGTSLSEIAGSLGGGLPANRISSGKSRSGSSQLIALVPLNSNNTVTLEGASTNFVYFVEGVQQTLTTDVIFGSLTVAPSSNNTALVNNASLGDEEHTKTLGEYGTAIPYDTAGSAITALDGTLAAFSINNGSLTEHFLARVDNGNSLLTEVKRGYFFNSSDAPVPRVVFTDGDTITLLKLTWVFATTSQTLDVVFNEPFVQADTPGSPNIGDYWFDLINDKWKKFSGGSFIDSDATLIGVCAQDATNTIAARTFDQFVNKADLNTVVLEKTSATEIAGDKLYQEVNVFGNTIRFQTNKPKWDITADRDSGVSEVAETSYFFYLNESGDTIISDVAPYDRTDDLKGYYHPHQTWRCVGQAFNDESSNLQAVLDFQPKELETSYIMTQKVASSALTLRLHTTPNVLVRFRDASTEGLSNNHRVHGVLQLVVPSTATLGHTSAQAENIFGFLALNDQTLEMAVSSADLKESKVYTTTAMGTGSDNALIYTGSVLSSVPFRTMFYGESTQSTAGTWAALLTEVAKYPFEQVDYFKESASSAAFTTTSATLVDITNLAITFTCSGERPVAITFRGNGTNLAVLGSSGATVGASATFAILRDSTVVSLGGINATSGSGSTNICQIPPNSMNHYHVPARGVFTFKLQAQNQDASDTVSASNIIMQVREVML